MSKYQEVAVLVAGILVVALTVGCAMNPVSQSSSADEAQLVTWYDGPDYSDIQYAVESATVIAIGELGPKLKDNSDEPTEFPLTWFEFTPQKEFKGDLKGSTPVIQNGREGLLANNVPLVTQGRDTSARR